MAKERKASVIYEGNASQLVYAFPFDYLQKKFVKVEDIYTNITELTMGVDYTVEDKQVRLVKGIPIGHFVKIYRETPTAPLVEWQDASVLRSADMTLQELQLLHIQEEFNDHLNEELGVGESFANQAKKAAEEAKEYRDIAIAGQLQADWNEEDVKAKSFIKGKPTELLRRIQFMPYITPKLFGAAGDGVTDDTVSFQKCITQAQKGKYAVFIPAGAYKITSKLSLPRGLCIYGINEQWPSLENDVEEFRTGTCLLLSDNGSVECNSYNDISHLTIYGTGAEIGLTVEDRCYVHDISLMHLLIGISNTSENSNLSRFERITITNTETAISLQANNSKNSQSLTFKDIDIRDCTYGLVSDQPSNKFFNFCVQVGRSGGCAVHLLSGASNNVFYGSYFENVNYTHEIVCDKGASYNHFLGGRIYTMASHLFDNDGTNVIVGKSTQYFHSNYVAGSMMFKHLGIAGNAQSDNPPWVAEFSSDENSVTLGVKGTLNEKQFLLDKSISFNPECRIQGIFEKTSLPFSGVYTTNNVSIAANTSLIIQSTMLANYKVTMLFANCMTHPQLHCNAAIAADHIIFNVYNTGSAVVDTPIKIAVIAFLDVKDT